MQTWRWVFLLTFVMTLGCIVGDQLTTITIQPDGSTDVVTWRSNQHSTSTGDDAVRELAEYKARFDQQNGDEFNHIRRADGEIIQSVWLRENAPFANVIKARLPSAESLEKYFSNPPEDAQFSMVGTFRQDGLQRKLTIRIHVPADQTGKSSATSQSVSELLQESANGISQTRIAVANGTIIQAKGFIVASDGQSALLDVSNILNTLQSEGGNSEFWLLWKINQ